VTICVDGWSKKNLANSFLGISACFFDAQCKPGKPQHVTLSIAELPYPHTGTAIAECMSRCLSEWEISAEKVLMVVSDNGANIIKAVQILAENAAVASSVVDEYETAVSDTEIEDEVEGDNSEEESEDDTHDSDSETFELETVSYRRMMCMAHTLQLVIKTAYNHYNTLLTKARHLVGKMRKSGKAMQELHIKCGKTVFTDNATRWNSTFNMIKRLLELRSEVSALLVDMRIDSLQVSEWDRLSEFCTLLEPFATQTNILQTDSRSISYAIPALFDLECHLKSFSANKTIAKTMLNDMHTRFSCLLSPDSPSFNPIPAASCLLDPGVAAVMLTTELAPVCEAAKTFILSQVCEN